MKVVLYIHLVAALVWVGGLITMAFVVPAVGEATADYTAVRSMARRFGTVSWVAMAVMIVTGVMFLMIGSTLSGALLIKLALVATSVVLAAWHSLSGGRHTPRTRGMTQGLILLLGLVIVGLALAD